MRLQNCWPVLAGTFLGLLLVGCGDGPMATRGTAEPETTPLATELSVGLPDPAKAPLVTLVAPNQKVTVVLGGSTPTLTEVEGRFQATLHIYEDGEAQGHGLLVHELSHVVQTGAGARRSGSILFYDPIRATQLDADDEALVVQVEGEGQLCSGEKARDCVELDITATIAVRRKTNTQTGDDSLSQQAQTDWTFSRRDVHSSQLEAVGFVIERLESR